MASNPLGLNPADIVSTTVSLQAAATTVPSQNIPLILGSSDVINVVDRIRTYSGGSTALTTIAAQFTTTAPEYLAAQAFFDQTPQPQVIKIGRWADTSTSALLLGASLTSAQQLLSNFTVVTAGSTQITYGTGAGTLHTVSALNLSSATSLPQVASLLNAQLSGATVTWDSLFNRFKLETAAVGPNAFSSFATATGSGTDITQLLGWGSTQGGSIVLGISNETPATAATILRAIDKTWYDLHFATQVGGVWSDTDANLTDAAHVAVAQFIEACSPPSTYGISRMDPNMLLGTSTTDVASLIQAGGFKRSRVFYTTTNFAAALEMFAIFATVDYTGSNTATIAMFKQLPGSNAETLTESQNSALLAKNGNVFVNYSNGAAIIQNGTEGSGNFYDEIHGTDAMAAAVQSALFNGFLVTTPKIPQTDQGMRVLHAIIDQVMQQFVTNGVLGRDLVWTGGNIGVLQTGQTLSKGYYIYQQPLSTQSVAARQSRQAPLFQIACNLAGAVQGASVQINVVR
jgi:hypothetical protein